MPLSSTAQRVLREVHTSQAEERLRAGSAWQQTGYVFTTELGTPYEPRNALRALQAAARQVGLPDIGLHTLRHSAAAVMLVNGVPLKVVSEVLGHASIGITGDIYGHVSPDVTRRARPSVGGARVTKGGRKWWSNRADRPTTGPHVFRNWPLTRALRVGASRLELLTPCL